MKQNTAETEQEKKKGLLRLFELLDRDLAKFFKAGILSFIGLLPLMLCTAAAVILRAPLLLAGNILCGMIAAPQICATADTVMRSVRDQIGWWWWESYRAAWKRDLRASLLPGAIFGLLYSVEIYLLYSVARLENPAGEFWLLFASVLISLAVTGSFLPMLVCMELPFGALIKNCFFLFFSSPLRCIAAAVLRLLYAGVILLWFPLTLVLFFLGSVWLPMLLSSLLLWPVLDANFGLSEAYREIRKEKWST